ncbi:hypothetical protein P691DRAFT_692554 [Macrolepiota fuliginosa MF-IS2]|uniref:DNA polymerase delta subunit 4 n=1 Tax=Macrolepiota fuliginosa MF-IS2 TaxID=1400762 RepID=A0A9P6C749_9AGAR|nr:hypothetical protein P691DRAFT_692554 [Macrolepiota fuliginosa MF-IS2]
MPSFSGSPSNTSGGGSMKQVKLNFPSSKRTASASGAKKAAGSLTGSRSNIVSKSEAIPEVEDEESSVLKVKESKKEESRKISIKPRSSSDSHKNHVQQDSSAEKKLDIEQLPELNIKDPRWKKLFDDAKTKRGGLPLVHGKDESSVHQILRAFDLNYDYGPCIGVTRLERWERAGALGLNPPPEVRDILLTREGVEQRSYSECVFQDEV